MVIAVLFLSGCISDPVAEETPFSLVNPFIGTGGHGHTYPGAAWPFGMVQLSPDTRLEGWDGCSGYHYTDDTIYGFSHTHLSGTGVSDYGDVLLMPFTGEASLSEQYFCKSGFNKEDERAMPGYYSVHLRKTGIDVNLTVGKRSGYHSYFFPDHTNRQLYIDLDHRDEVLDASIEFISENAIQGYRISKAWAEEQYVYFYIETSVPFSDVNKKGNRATLSFGESEKEQIIHLEIGISAVSEEGARRNLEADRAELDAENMAARWALADERAQQAWGNALNRITVKGGSREERTVFYTSLYHSLLNPNLFTDADRKYRGMDQKIHRAAGYDHYTVFSLWDTYRAAHPLFTIIEEDRTNDFIKTFLAQYRDGGKIPIWELAANYTGCMIGYHAIPVIADAHAKGIDDYDAILALKAMVHSATMDELGLPAYRKYGYIPSDMEPESVSKTLEYSYDDWCISDMALRLGENETADEFEIRSQSWKHLFDPKTKFMRARLNGAFVEPFDPSEVNFHFTEANAWQYSLMVPHDVQGLIDLFGGKEAMAARLDELFTTSSATTGREQADITGLIGQYAHGNEPSHHMAYLYNYVDQPWKTQEMVRRIMEQLYSDQPDGLSGNEDCGQMSSWFVLSAAGFYPVAPGNPYYSIGSPLFEEIVFQLENGNTFRVLAENNGPDRPYIKSATLNGEKFDESFLAHKDIMNGGTLHLVMSDQPAKEWGVTDGSKLSGPRQKIVPAPFAEPALRVFNEKVKVSLASADQYATINYRIDGGNYSPYNAPFEINDDTEIEFTAMREGFVSSPVQNVKYLKRRQNWGIKLGAAYAPQYAAGGDQALIDQLRGGPDYRTGTWQGYEHENLVATVDLGKLTNIRTVGIGFLQDENSWIFMPEEVRFEVSDDGVNFRDNGIIVNHIDPSEKGTIIHDYKKQLDEKARYIRVTGVSPGYCPEWHKGAGGKCWVFADEITVE